MSGSRNVQAGPIMLSCMDPDYRDQLDRAMDEWRASLVERERMGVPPPNDPVYAFAYWLFRYSGLVALPPWRSAHPETPP